MQSDYPVGVFDSGVGGLSVLERIHDLLPAENLVYVADSGHAPYGFQSRAFIQARCRSIMDFFLARPVKAVVIACNTATAAAVAELRAEYSLPIIGMEPAIKPAAEQSRTGVVGVLATAGTIDSDKFITLKSRFAGKVEILTRPCPGLVELIEEVETDSSALALNRLLEQFIAPMREKNADTLVLGCTHYPLIAGQIKAVAGGAAILDTGAAVARELQRRLGTGGLLRESGPGTVRFFTSGDLLRQQSLLGRYWADDLELESLPA